ncbi:hypothetical protein TNCV_2859611 [Trichonephila clavipes]|nr:hypothetical protein TNCV_2859611 [Trichonephila clavipes]
MWEAPYQPLGVVLLQNWGITEPKRTVTCKVLKATDNDKRTSSPFATMNIVDLDLTSSDKVALIVKNSVRERLETPSNLSLTELLQQNTTFKALYPHPNRNAHFLNNRKNVNDNSNNHLRIFNRHPPTHGGVMEEQ